MNSKSAIGAIVCIAGSLLTYAGYTSASSASGGGKYYVFVGAIVGGLYLFFKGFTEEEDSKASEQAMKVASQVNAFVNQGIALSNQGKYDDAIKHYNNAINISPYDGSIWSYKGNSLFNQGNYDEAIKCYDEAIQLGKKKAECNDAPNLELLMRDPINAASWNNKGLALMNKKNYDEALKCFDETVKLSLQDSKAWHLKGVISEILGRTSEANAAKAKAKELEVIQACDKAIQLKPDDANAYFCKGAVLGSQSKYDEAIQAFDKAIQLKPDHAEAYFNKGVALHKRSKIDKAIHHMIKPSS